MPLKKKGRSGLGRFAVMMIMCAVCIRMLSSAATSEKLAEWKRKAEERVPSAHAADAKGPWSIRDIISAFLSEKAPAEEKAIEQPAEEKDKKEELTVWEYTPGGELKPNTYPIENTTISPKSEKGYVKYQNIWVKNDSSKGIDLKWLLGAKLPFEFSGTGPHVLIIHTHGSECYLPQGRESYTLDDVERTSDKRYNVIRVGDELEKTLKENGITAIHDRNIYDSPSYNGSYSRSLAAIGEALRKNPSIKVIIDVHRDAMTSAEGVKYRTVANVGGEQVAQLMLVMSTGESGLPHPEWAENLKLAVKVQNAMATKYPGIMRPMNLRKERFNMHATRGSMLVEVGTSANSMAEALASIKLFGKELATILKTAK